MTRVALSGRRRRWFIPPVLAALLVGGAVVIPGAASATGRPSLKPVTAAALVGKVLGAQVKHLSGSLSLTANLGLPDLSLLTGDSSDPLSFLSGTHTAELWYGGSDKLRVALPEGSGENDLIVNGTTAYFWQSSQYSVTKIVAPTLGLRNTHQRVAIPGGALQTTSAPVNIQLVAGAGLPGGLGVAATPAQMASQLLGSIGPSTAVSVTATAYVAGRPVYELALSPRNAQSLVRRVVIAIDSATGTPLRVQVYARGDVAAALSFGFNQISFAAPEESNFDFTPPKGAKLTTVNQSSVLGAFGRLIPALQSEAVFNAVPSGGSAAYPSKLTIAGPGFLVGYAPLSGGLAIPKPRVLGSGWTSVLVVPGDDVSIARAYVGLSSAGKHGVSVLGSILSSGTAVSGSWGKGHLIHSSLIDVLSLADGTVLVGAVTPAALEAAAAQRG